MSNNTARKSNRRPYTEEDVAQLTELAAAGYTRAVIAEKLGRSLGSIHGTCSYRHIRTYGSRAYTKADIEKLIELAAAGDSHATIAIKMGRSIGSISGTCRYYNIHTHGRIQSRVDPIRIGNVQQLAAEGLSQRAIAERLGLPFATVKSDCYRYHIRTFGTRWGRVRAKA